MVTSRQATNTSPVSTNAGNAGYFSTHNAASQGAYGNVGRDNSVAQSGNINQIQDRVRSIFDNREVELSHGAEQGETPEQRVARIAQQIVEGRTFGDVRQSVDRLAGSADWSLESAGLPVPTQPQLTPEMLNQIGVMRGQIDQNYQGVQADAADQRARLEAQQQLDMERLAEDYERHRRDMMFNYGDRGMAFQPAGAGQGKRRAAEGEARDSADLERMFGDRLGQVAQQVSEARRMRDQQLADLEMQEQMMRDQLIRGELANFGQF